MSRAAGWAPASAARGMATTSTAEALFEGEPKKNLPTWGRGAFVRRQIMHVFLFGSGAFASLPIEKRGTSFISRPHSGLDRRAALANELLGYLFPVVPCTAWPPVALWPPPPLASLLGFRSRTSTLGLSFFCSLILPFFSCFFGFGLCESRRKVAVPLRPSRLGSGRPNGSAYLSNASAVELHAPQNLRPFFPSTNSHAPYYHYPCHVILAFRFFRNLQFLIDI